MNKIDKLTKITEMMSRVRHDIFEVYIFVLVWMLILQNIWSIKMVLYFAVAVAYFIAIILTKLWEWELIDEIEEKKNA